MSSATVAPMGMSSYSEWSRSRDFPGVRPINATGESRNAGGRRRAPTAACSVRNVRSIMRPLGVAPVDARKCPARMSTVKWRSGNHPKT